MQNFLEYIFVVPMEYLTETISTHRKTTISVLAVLAILYWARLLIMSLSFKRKEEYLPCCELSREFVKHEDSLTNNRITWLLTVHGLLFAALGVVLSEDMKLSGLMAQNFVAILSTLGILITLASTTTLFVGLFAVMKHSAHEPVDAEEEVVGYKIVRPMEFLTPTILYPIIFILVWYAVAIMFLD